MSWSFDQKFWHPAPSDNSVRRVPKLSLKPNLEAHQFVVNTVGAGDTEPVDHELLREAWNQMDTNPRSALLIGIAAAELAMKRCISELVPAADWLAMNLPTPPLDKLLREYLPVLPVRCSFGGQVKPPPESVLQILRKGVTIRNGIAHKGNPSPPYETLRRYFGLCEIFCI
jgi:hypothetical protein